MKRKLKKIIKESLLSKLNLSKVQNSFGYIELISPNLISGWVLDKTTKFVEVRLVDNNQILASAPIDIYREDVNSKFNYKNATGFNLDSHLKKKKLIIKINCN